LFLFYLLFFGLHPNVHASKSTPSLGLSQKGGGVGYVPKTAFEAHHHALVAEDRAQIY
jgi:hypothetical protein